MDRGHPLKKIVRVLLIPGGHADRDDKKLVGILVLVHQEAVSEPQRLHVEQNLDDVVGDSGHRSLNRLVILLLDALDFSYDLRAFPIDDKVCKATNGRTVEQYLPFCFYQYIY